MAGIESKLGEEVYISDETEGIIPRAFRFLWFCYLIITYYIKIILLILKKSNLNNYYV